MQPLHNPEHLARRIRAAMSKRAATLATAAGQMQVPPDTLRRVRLGATPCVETYLRIVRWLDAAEVGS
jgi:hypothetical protein